MSHYPQGVVSRSRARKPDKIEGDPRRGFVHQSVADTRSARTLLAAGDAADPGKAAWRAPPAKAERDPTATVATRRRGAPVQKGRSMRQSLPSGSATRPCRLTCRGARGRPALAAADGHVTPEAHGALHAGWESSRRGRSVAVARGRSEGNPPSTATCQEPEARRVRVEVLSVVAPLCRLKAATIRRSEGRARRAAMLRASARSTTTGPDHVDRRRPPSISR